MSETVYNSDHIKRCEICQVDSNLKRCNRCKCVYYCSREHQKQDWLKHKVICSASAASSSDSAAKDSPPPQPQLQLQQQESTEPEDVKEEQAEIESILDFGSITSELPSTSTVFPLPQTKDIFSDLINSTGNDYMGPSDNSIVTGIEDMVSNIDHEENIKSSVSECNDSHLEVYHETDFINHESKADSDGNEDFIRFDTRPFRKLKFPLPESYHHKDLAEFIGLRLINLGYCVVDNVFTEEDINGLTSEIKFFDSTNELKTGQLGGGKTSGEDEKKSTRTDIRSDKMKWIEGNEDGLVYAGKVITVLDSIMQFLSPFLNLKGYGNIEGRSKAMMTCYPGNGAFYRRHIDNPSKDGRRITCILYLNKDWNVETDGGLLRILPPAQEKQVDIPPKANRLLYFWSDKRNPHEVHPAYRERYAMTVWYFDSEERTASKVQRLKSETDSIKEKITELEEKRRQMEEAARQQQIENKAMEAVRALSQEEVQALSVLIDSHPQPRQVMTAMGISSHIQEALIRHLTNL